MKLQKLVFLGALALNSIAFATEAKKWEIGGGFAGLLGVQRTGETGGSASSTNGVFSLSNHFGYFLDCGFEPTMTTAFNWQTGDSGLTALSLLVGPTYNFNTDVSNSIYIAAKAGLYLLKLHSNQATLTAFAYSVGLGKRFEIFSNVSWSPEIQWSGVTSAKGSTPNATELQQASTMAWAIIPIQLSVIF